MKSTTTQVDVSSSYRMVSHIETMEASAALVAIRSDDACKYSSAILNEDYSVTLTSYEIVCPYCANVHAIKRHNQLMRWHIDTMIAWADPQLTLFPEEYKSELFFFSPKLHHFTCPKCSKQSDNRNRESSIWVTHQKNKVVVRSEVTDLGNILQMPYLPHRFFSVEFPFYEQIEFNFRNGHTCIRVMTDNDRILHTVDITNSPAILAECELADWLYKHESVKQMIIECFQTVSKSAIPMEPCDVSIEDFVFLTRFVGYDKGFYTAIPYDKETLVIDRSFRKLDKLHTIKNAVDYLTRFSFAKYKSTRKQICEMAGLLFYLAECDILFRAVGDVNVFRNILESRYAFDMLITLHEHPISSEFLVDYCKIKGATSLFKKINSERCSWFDFRWYMLNYCSLSQYSRSLEHKKWKDRSSFDFTDRTKPTRYSLPLIQGSPKDAKCVINGFAFKPLRNTSECFKVGKELRNCLGGWESYDSMVIAVIFQNDVVAAFEIWDKAIAQAHTYKNGSIDEIEGLPAAIEAWAKRNQISCSTKELIEGW